MTHFIVLVLALLIGGVAGLRALTAPAVMAWAAALRWINLDGTWVQWLSHPATVAVLTVLAVATSPDALPTSSVSAANGRPQNANTLRAVASVSFTRSGYATSRMRPGIAACRCRASRSQRK